MKLNQANSKSLLQKPPLIDRSIFIPFFLCLTLGLTWYLSIKTESKSSSKILLPYIANTKNAHEIYQSTPLLAEVVNNLNNKTPLGKHLYIMHKRYSISNVDFLQTYTIGDWCLLVLANLQHKLLPQKPDAIWLHKVTSFIVNKKTEFENIENISIESKQILIDTWINLIKEYAPLNKLIHG